MKRVILPLAAAALLAGPASAAITFSFDPGAPSPDSGFVVIDDFDDMTGIASFANAQIKVPPADGDGAPPANSSPAGTSYLSVLGDGFATINLAGVRAFQFDWGSIDSYNTLTIHSSIGNVVVIPGGNFPNLANGNQAIPGTNGLFTVRATAGETFSGFTLASTTNSFEIDNLAVAVPEPGTWALMITGFGGAGAMLRHRRRRVLTAA